MLFICTDCDYKTNKKSEYERHLLTKKHIKNTKEAKYICEDCNYRCNNKKQFDKHYRNKKHLNWVHNMNKNQVDFGYNSTNINTQENKIDIKYEDKKQNNINTIINNTDFKEIKNINFIDRDELEYTDIFYKEDISNKKIEHIIHMADIHIRLVDRHIEYNEVFNNLYNNLRNERKDILDKSAVVICGDILHQKNILSPEVIYHTRQFLLNLAKILPVIIIAGNHDANLANRDRLDSLSVIAQNINNLHYLKDTGLYKFHNILFSVSSVFDEYRHLYINGDDIDYIKNKYNLDNNEIDYNIALYHGAVNGCKSSTGFNLCGVSQKAFSGFDYVFLGDIHQYQYLNKERTIAYSSSLIQQNFGETLQNHGYLLWNLKDEESEYINIDNNYGFYTFYLNTTSSLEKIKKCLDSGYVINDTKIPVKCNIRLMICNNLISFDKDIIDIKQSYPQYDYSIMTNIRNTTSNINIDDNIHGFDLLNNNCDDNNDCDDSKSLSIGTSENIKNKHTSLSQSLLDIDTQNKYICELLNLPYDIDENIIFDDENGEEIIKIVKLLKQTNKKYNDIVNLGIELDENNTINDSFHMNKTNQAILGSEKNKIYNWKLHYLEFENMFTYTEKQFIDFRNMNGINGIFGENHAGKSSILDIILFCLFEKTSRTIKKTRVDIINKSKKKFNCKLEFSINQDIYTIHRYNSGKKFYLNFYKNGYSLNGPSSVDTNKIISSIIGTYDDFVTMTFSLQENMDGFVYLSQADRKKFLYRIFKLNIFEDIEKLVNSDLRNKKSEYKILNNKINEESRHNYEDKIQDIETNIIPKLCQEISKTENEINNNINELNNNKKQIQPLPLILEKYTDALDNLYNNNIDDLNDMTTKELSNVIISLKEYIKKTISLIKKDKKDIIENKENDISEKYEQLIIDEKNRLKDDKAKYKIELKDKKQEKSLLNKKIKKLISKKEKILKKSQIYSDSIKNNNTEIVIEQYKTYINNKDEYENIIKRILDDRVRCDKEYNKLKNHKYNKECEYCCNNPFVIDAVNSGKKSKKLGMEIEQYENKLEKIKEIIESYGNDNIINIDENIKNIDNDIYILTNKFDNILKSIELIRGRIKMIKNNTENNIQILNKQKEIDIKNIHNEIDIEYNQKNRDIDILKECLKCLREYKKIKKANKEFYNNCNKLDIIIREKRNKLDILKLDKKEIEIHLDSIRKNREYYDKMMSDWDILKIEIKVLDLYIKAINKNGIPLFFIKKIVPEIERRVNQNLSSFVDFKLNLEIDDKDIHIFIRYDDINSSTHSNISDNKWNVSNCCGFEKFIINLALRIVIQNVANISKPNFIAFDEGWGCFDDKNIMNIHKIFDFMKIHYDFVLLITHIEKLKNSVDKYYNVVRNVKNVSSIIT